MSDVVIGSEIQFKIDQALASLKQIGDAGSAAGKDVARELSRNLKAAEKAAQDAAKASKTAGAAFTDMKGAAELLGKSGRSLGSILGAISPELGAITQEAGHAGHAFVFLTEAAEAGNPILLGIAAAVAAGAAAWGIWSHQTEDAATRAEFLESHLHDLDTASRSLEDAETKLAVATGTLTVQEGKLEDIREKANRSLDDYREKQEGARDAAFAAVRAGETLKSNTEVLGESFSTGAKAIADWWNNVDTARFELKKLDEIDRQYQTTIGETLDAEQKTVVAADHHAAALKGLTDAQKDADRQRKEYEAGLKEDARLYAAESDRVTALIAQIDALGESEADRIRAKAAAMASGLVGLSPEAEAAEVVKVEAWKDAQLKVLRDRDLKDVETAAAAKATAEAQGAMVAINAWADFGSEVKNMGKGAFAFWKATAIAQALGNTYLAVTNAIANIPPPYGEFAAVGLEATGLIQVAKIAAEQPSFGDTPGVQKMGGGGSVRFADGDFFAAAQSPGDLAAQVGGGGVSLMVVEHRAYGRYIRDEARAPTSLASAIGAASSTVPGRRARGAA